MYKHFKPTDDQLTYFIAVNVKEVYVRTPDGKRHTRSSRHTPSGKYPTQLESFPKKRENKEILKKDDSEAKITKNIQ